MDKERFDALCLQEQAADGGIGTLGEKRLHRVLKVYFEPRPACREQPLAGYVADILNEEGVTEVQTRNYGALRKKLAAFLPLMPVRVVCPLPARKWVSWVDPATGEVSRRHPSPKRGAPIDAFYELVRIAPLLAHPNLTLHLLFFDADEYRVRDGWDKSGKRGSTRAELQPLGLCAEQEVRGPAAYADLLPAGLPDPFTLPELRAAARRSETLCRRVVYTLEKAGALSRAGKRGRALLYRRTLPPEGRTPAAGRP